MKTIAELKAELDRIDELQAENERLKKELAELRKRQMSTCVEVGAANGAIKTMESQYTTLVSRHANLETVMQKHLWLMENAANGWKGLITLQELITSLRAALKPENDKPDWRNIVEQAPTIVIPNALEPEGKQ